jgi:hypothetical protein
MVGPGTGIGQLFAIDEIMFLMLIAKEQPVFSLCAGCLTLLQNGTTAAC